MCHGPWLITATYCDIAHPQYAQGKSRFMRIVEILLSVRRVSALNSMERLCLSTAATVLELPPLLSLLLCSSDTQQNVMDFQNNTLLELTLRGFFSIEVEDSHRHCYSCNRDGLGRLWNSGRLYISVYSPSAGDCKYSFEACPFNCFRDDVLPTLFDNAQDFGGQVPITPEPKHPPG
jgi:hypothetical protein